MPVFDTQAEVGVLRAAGTILGVSGQWVIHIQQDQLTKSRGGKEGSDPDLTVNLRFFKLNFKSLSPTTFEI